MRQLIFNVITRHERELQAAIDEIGAGQARREFRRLSTSSPVSVVKIASLSSRTFKAYASPGFIVVSASFLV